MKAAKPLFVLVVLSVVVTALLQPPSRSGLAQTTTSIHPASVPAPSVRAGGLTTYTLQCGLWRVDNGLVSTIHIKNALVVAPLQVTPVLYMSDGREYDLPPVELATAGTRDINVNEALAKVPPTIHPSEYGSAALRYEYKNPGHLLASMEIINLPKSLVFTFPFNGIGDDMPGEHTLEAVWWKQDAAVGGFVALTNVTGGVLQVEVQAVDSRGAWLPAQTFGVLAHSVQMLHLNALTAGLSGPENQAGGLRLRYNGDMGAIAVSSGLVNERQGYSANIPFWFHDVDSSTPAAITYASVGVMIGRPDAMMGFPRSTEFTPYTVLRNATAGPLPVKVTLNYMAEPKPISLSLPVQPLGPYETRQLDLPAMLGALGLRGFRGDVNLLFSFTGHGGDLVLATGSIDQTENYVFAVEPQGVGRSLGKAGHYWISANDFDTMYTLFNPTDKAQDFDITIHYGDGSGTYKMPMHLEAQASTMIDMMMLIGEKRPDVHGNVIPPRIQQGSIVIESAQGEAHWMTLVVSGAVYNPRRGTCGVVCTQCYGYSGPVIIIDPHAVAVASTTTLYGQATYANGSLQYMSTTSWSSTNTGVATVNGSGVVSGVWPGSMTISAQFAPEVVFTGMICDGAYPQCPVASMGAGSGGSVTSVQVSLVDLPSDQVTVTLSGPAGASGQLLVTWNGPNGNANIASAVQGPGTYTFNPTLSNLVAGQYTGVTAQWTVNGTAASGSYTNNFNVLGSYRHSQYNTPYESTCLQGGATAYLVNSVTCAYTTGLLKSDFISQSTLNGNGVTVNAYYNYYAEQNAQYCYNHGYLPSAAQGIDFAFVSSIVPQCGSSYSLGSNTVAVDLTSPGHPLQCGDQIVMVGAGPSGTNITKTVTDECPICERDALSSILHIDNYSTLQACRKGAFIDVAGSPFVTIRLR